MDSPNLRWPKKSADWHSYTTHEIEKSAGIDESKRGRDQSMEAREAWTYPASSNQSGNGAAPLQAAARRRKDQ
jgi:hypothetical protein